MVSLCSSLVILIALVAWVWLFDETRHQQVYSRAFKHGGPILVTVALIGGGGLVVGVWLLTSSDPRGSRQRRTSWLSVWCRCGGVAVLAGYVIAWREGLSSIPLTLFCLCPWLLLLSFHIGRLARRMGSRALHWHSYVCGASVVAFVLVLVCVAEQNRVSLPIVIVVSVPPFAVLAWLGLLLSATIVLSIAARQAREEWGRANRSR